MKKQTLIPALAIAAVAAASLSLPATASADSFTYKEKTVVRGDHKRDDNLRQVHEVERRHRDSYHQEPPRWVPPRHHHDHGRHFGYQQRYEPRVEYRPPMVRYEPRYEYRAVERYEPRYEDSVRVRISYDLHL